LEKGVSLILDAKLVLVSVEAPPQVVRGRLERRLENSEGKSDADWVVCQRMKSSAQKIQRKHHAVDTSRDITPVLNKIVEEVNH
jgi:predicted kinase